MLPGPDFENAEPKQALLFNSWFFFFCCEYFFTFTGLMHILETSMPTIFTSALLMRHVRRKKLSQTWVFLYVWAWHHESRLLFGDDCIII